MKNEYAVCIKNKGYIASLEIKKIYKVIYDVDAEKHGQLRVVDESGDDYLYPIDFFSPIKVPKAVKNIFSYA